MAQVFRSIAIGLSDEHYEQSPVQQQIISIAFFATQVKFSQDHLHDPKGNHLQGTYPAIAIGLYNATTYSYPFPHIQDSYDDTMQDMTYPDLVEQDEHVKASNLAKKQIRSIISAHYGYYLDRFTKEDYKDFQIFMAYQFYSSPFPKLVVLPQNSHLAAKRHHQASVLYQAFPRGFQNDGGYHYEIDELSKFYGQQIPIQSVYTI